MSRAGGGSRIERRFAALRGAGRGGFVAFVTAGDPDLETSREILMGLPAAGADLIGPIWLWRQTLMNNDETFVPPDPNNYNVQFRPDGTVSVQADCNQVGGTYTVDGSFSLVQDFTASNDPVQTTNTEDDGVVFFGNGTTVTLFDLTNPGNPIELATLRDPGSLDLDASGSTLVSASGAGVRVVDPFG